MAFFCVRSVMWAIGDPGLWFLHAHTHTHINSHTDRLCSYIFKGLTNTCTCVGQIEHTHTHTWFIQLALCVRLLICLILRLATAAATVTAAQAGPEEEAEARKETEAGLAVAAAVLVATLPQLAAPFQFQCERLSSRSSPAAHSLAQLPLPLLLLLSPLNSTMATLGTADDYF